MRFRTGYSLWLSLALLLALSSGGCNRFRRKKSPPPPPPPPAVQRPATAPAKPSAGETAVKPPVTEPEPEPPPDTRTVRLPGPATHPAKPSKSPQAPAAAAQPPPPVAPQPAPELGQMLSPEEQRRYTRITVEALARARGLVHKIETRRLSTEQRAAYDRILTFIRQAEELRNRDLVQAASLADRAAVLAADLAAGVR